jgi:hypothetical protein
VEKPRSAVSEGELRLVAVHKLSIGEGKGGSREISSGRGGSGGLEVLGSDIQVVEIGGHVRGLRERIVRVIDGTDSH